MIQKKQNNYIIVLIVILFLNICCQNKSIKPEIEIYTIKENFQNIEEKYDSLKKELIYAPEFTVTKDMLNSEPLITDKEILCIDTILGKIKLSENAVNKIVDLNPSMKYGVKFVICKDKEPLLTGYFWSSFSSYGSKWNCIEYDHTKKVSEPVELIMYKGNGLNYANNEKINFSNYSELIKTLEEAKKLNCLNY